jgi:proteasome lid subunit RPN8/RPN11
MSFYPPVESWTLPRGTLEASLDEMAIDGRLDREGVALWLGKREGGAAAVSHVVILRGRGVAKRRDLLEISADLLNDVTDVAIDLGVMLVGQIHSHAPGYGTDLSLTDRRCGIMVSDYLSVVAPDFALRPDTLITDCGVHVYVTGRGYRRLSSAEVSRRINVVNAAEVPVLTVGKE